MSSLNIESKLTKARMILSRHGPGGFVVYLSRFIFWRPRADKSCRIFFFVLDSPKTVRESIKASEGHTFRFATIEDINSYRGDPSWEIGDGDVLAFKRGDRCFLQFDGDTLVGYSWLAASHLVEIIWGFHFNMPNDTVYNYKGFTSPAYRGKGFQPLRHLKLLEHIKGKGQRRLFAYVDQLNLDSLRGLKKSGYKKVGVLRFERKGEKVRVFLKVARDIWTLERRS